MLPRLLSVLSPACVWVTLAILLWGLYRDKRRLDRTAVVLALFGLALSLALVRPQQRLFPDEDIYTQMAANLTRSPVAQLTLLGNRNAVEISTYYKEPAGYPVVLSLAFLVAGVRESVAFLLARLFYAASVGALYVLARTLLQNRWQALVAATVFAATPASLWYSVSSGTDFPAVLFAVLGGLGICTGNGALAASGLAMAAQTRLEMIVLMPILAFAPSIERQWKWRGLCLVVAQLLHVGWVISVAPALEQSEHIEQTFSWRYWITNVPPTLGFLLNPWVFPAAVTGAAVIAAIRISSVRRPVLILWTTLLFGVYFTFYAGSFKLNPRYSIQVAAPMAVMAASVVTGPLGYVATAASLIAMHVHATEDPERVQILRKDREFAIQCMERMETADLVVSGIPEVFINRGYYGLNMSFAAESGSLLASQFDKHPHIWYYAEPRSATDDDAAGRADRWIRSRFELRPVASQDAGGNQSVLYQLLERP